MSDFEFNRIITGDARHVLQDMPPDSVALSFWSPPYYVGKSYEADLSFSDWCNMVHDVLQAHTSIIQPGGFVAVNIGDILCFPDPDMPRFQANNVTGKKQSVTLSEVLTAKSAYPTANRHELAEILGCSEQTVQRRLEGNNVRGGKHSTPTRILLTGCLLNDWASEAGLYLYDQRIWHKDPCWANSRWHSTSYRAVDEFEHLYIFWKPGVTKFDRRRINAEEWSEWGSRGVWEIRSVRQNKRHEAEFPEELAARVIRLLSDRDDVILDPFVGSGTTTAVARYLGRQWLGIDKDPKSAELAWRRTNDARPDSPDRTSGENSLFDGGSSLHRLSVERSDDLPGRNGSATGYSRRRNPRGNRGDGDVGASGSAIRQGRLQESDLRLFTGGSTGSLNA